MSDEEETSTRTSAPIVVNVTEGQKHHRVCKTHEQSSDIESNEEYTEYEEEIVTSRRRVQHVTRNGKVRVNMTPPDQLLMKAKSNAKKFGEAGQVDKSIREWIRCLALTRIVHGNSHWRLAEGHVCLARAYLDLKGYAAQAEYHTELAKKILKSNSVITATSAEVPLVYKLSFQVYFILGSALTISKRYIEAEKALMEADRVFKLLSKQYSLTDREMEDIEINLAHALAKLYWKEKKYALACSKYDKLLEVAETRYGPDHILLVPLYQECGKVEQSKNRHADHNRAIHMFQQAHSIAGAKYIEGSVELVDTALDLARAYIHTGQEEAEASAESYLEECSLSCTTIESMGPLHPKTLEVKDELARLLIRTGRQDEAMRLLQSSLEPKCEVYGDYSEEVSDTHKLMASVHLAQGNIKTALKTYKKCYDVESLLLGKTHKKTKDTERTIDILMASPGLSSKFVLSKQDELQKRPRFNSIVSRSKPTS